MRLLLISLGSYGDILPMISIGQEFLQKGHEVSLMSNGRFKKLAISNGFSFIEISSKEEYQTTIQSIDVKKSLFLGLKLLDFLVIEPMEPMYLALTQLDTRDLLIVSYPVNIAAKAFAEKNKIPFISAVFAPILLKTALLPPRLHHYHFLKKSPRFINQLFFLFATSLLNLLLLNRINLFRKRLGLNRINDVSQWMLSEQLILALFDNNFCEKTEDWPTQTQVLGFPLSSLNNSILQEDLDTFIGKEGPTLLFTQGTPNAHNLDFFRSASKICKELHIKAIFVSQFVEALQELSQEHLYLCKSIHFQSVLPKLQGIVHHGGIGTSAQALRAGIPQIIVPWGVDQYDNSVHLQNMGVALELLPGRNFEAGLRDYLKYILQNQHMQKRAKIFGSQNQMYQGGKTSYDAIMKLFS
ncbi:glycosyltransferase [bacterium]|nr:glycosyltransferase [bacterium]